MTRWRLALDLPVVARRNTSLAVAHSLIRGRASDQYIVSYPRSGSTWLRTMLAGIMDPERGFEPEVFNRILPGVSGRRLPLVWNLKDPRILHSHTTFRKRLPRTVYVVRDGRDAIVSFYHYTVTRAGRQISFSEWFALYCRRWYGPRWHDHVHSWLTDGKKQLGDDLLIVKFEELKATTVAHVQVIARFLGLPTDVDAISRAVDMAGLERAREREKKERGELQNPDESFYRGGEIGQWRNYLVDGTYEKFMDMSEKALKLAGYIG